MAIAWLTDIHLDHLRVFGAAKAFGKGIAEQYAPEAVLVTGDIASGHNLVWLFSEFAEGVGNRPIYWIAGNHDFYNATIQKMQKRFETLAKNPRLVSLDTSDPVLFDDFALVGKYSWYDALNGNPQKSPILLSDFSLVGDFKRFYNEFDWEFQSHTGCRNPLLKKLRQLAAEAVAEVRPRLEKALQLRQRVIFATHVPPFEGAAWHLGQISDSDWQPWFSCRQMGHMLQEVAAQHPDHKILVLCGHSHSHGVYRHAPNLKVITGRAEYGAPDIAGLLTAPFDEWDQ